MEQTSKKKIVAIHQPNYLPWPGFFYKIHASDVFVFHDNVEYSKRYPTRRTRIRKSPDSDESCWLTVPLKKHSDFTLIKDLEIDHSQDWQGKHLRKISNSYSGAPFFQEVFPKIESWFNESKQFELLADMNIFLVRNVLKWLGIEREIRRSSVLSVEGSGSMYNVALVNYLGGSVYLSGKGGEKYQPDEDFLKGNIECKTTDFGKWLKTQPLENQVSSNSVLEAMFDFRPYQLSELFHTIQIRYGSNTPT